MNPPVQDGKPAKRPWWIAWQRLLLSRTSLEAQLYPPLKGDIRFRVYESTDFEACLEIYVKNESGRFPQTHRPQFEHYLRSEAKTLILAVRGSRVVGYGGLMLLAPNVGVLCYGIVDPEFQRQRIGTTLTLFRIAQLQSEPIAAFALIFAVDASIPIYRRFGFIDYSKWKAEDGREYPLGFLQVPCWSMDPLRATLKKRRIQVQGNLVLHQSTTHICEFEPNSKGRLTMQYRSRTDAAKPTGPPAISAS
jgi:[ribosomal protein S18]-alanine N-acetyltransferase